MKFSSLIKNKQPLEWVLSSSENSQAFVLGDKIYDKFEILGNASKLIDGKLRSGTKFISKDQTLRSLSKKLTEPGSYELSAVLERDINITVQFPKNIDVSVTKKRIEKTLELFETYLPSYFKLFNQRIFAVVPVSHYHKGKPHRRGFTLETLLGFTFTTIEERFDQPEEIFFPLLIIDLMHELGHTVLLTYQKVDTILEPEDLNKPIFSPIRRSARRAIMSFHACVANAYMLEAIKHLYPNASSLLEKKFLEKTFIELVEMQKISLKLIKKNTKQTVLGKRIVKELVYQTKNINLNNITGISFKPEDISYFTLIKKTIA
ncbi:MAG: hypothetical protein VX642_05425 [Bdellovibrionota bacterium]|nr:hypothetical protein [Bdellovibrionota bacterium]